MNDHHHEGHCHNHKCACHAQPKATTSPNCSSEGDCGCEHEPPPDDDPEHHSHEHHNYDDHRSHHCGCDDGCGCGHSHDEAISAPFSRPLTIFGGFLVASAFLPIWGDLAAWIMAAGTLLIGYPLFASGLKAIFTAFSFDELGLLTIAVAASLGLAATSTDSFEGTVEAMAVTVLFRLGNYLEARAIAKSRRDIEALTHIRPDTALLLLPNGEQRSVAAEAVTIGSSILLKAGDRIPIDCEVVSGAGYVDLSAITGEPIPIQTEPGTQLPSGAINLDGLLTCRTTASFEDSAASRILRLVRESAEQKGSAEKLISRFAKVYTPAVVGLAILLAVLPPLLGSGTFGMWLSRALVFLVASCPCALVISVPLTFFAGVGTASRSGILVKGTRYLEALAKTDCVVFDKTGTLTCGVPTVAEMKLSTDFSDDRLLAYALAAEQSSNHPAARAIVAYAGEQPRLEVSDFTEHSGMGVSLMCDEKHILCGSFRLMEQYGIDYSSLAPANIYLAVDKKLACSFALTDLPREEAAEAIAALRDLGVKSLAMLTGDAQSAAEKTATQLGIDTVFSQLLPEQKSAQLSVLREGHRSTLFVGDGINDAPVLTSADVGVAMGLGTDTAIEAADVVLVSEQLTALSRAIKIARRTVRKANQNIAFALAVKAVVLLLGAMGLATMWMAVFADVGVSILAVLNSLTLLSKK